ncbi:MFS transporter [Leucobacter soli]|uniref:MFS transporter n=1 Tax=Leucobacter soli TaxID=2812850 RepID=UPI003605D041
MVWSITVGAVIGPLLIGPGEVVGHAIGVTPLAGVFVFAFVAQILAALSNWLGLRPDPLLTAREILSREPDPEPAGATEPVGAATVPEPAFEPGTEPATATDARSEASRRRALIVTIFVIAMAQAIMVGLMAMTPLHLMHHEGTAEIVGITLSLHIAGMYALSPVFGSLAGRLGCVPVIMIGWAITLLAVALAYISGSSHLLVQVALTLVGVGWGAVTVAGAALLTELTTIADRPRWQGRSDTFMSASGAVAGALSGVGFAFGDFGILALFAGGLLALGAVASIRLGLGDRSCRLH